MFSPSLFRAGCVGCVVAVIASCAPSPAAAPTTTASSTTTTTTRAVLAGEAGPTLAPTRQLRRLLVSLEGRIPTIAELEALEALPTEADKHGALLAQVDASLASVAFYEQMLTFGHDMMRTSRYVAGNTDEGFWKGDLTADLVECPADTLHAGVWGVLSEDYSPTYGDKTSVVCNDPQAAIATTTPWWDPTTTVQLIGRAANTASTANGVDCGHIATDLYGHNTSHEDSTCGCGPHAHFCMLARDKSFHQDFTNLGSRHRSAWEQPARLFAHLAWHDLALDKLVVGDISVGDLNMRHMDWRFGRQTLDNDTSLDADPNWWRPETWTTPASPDVPAASPLSWHEYRTEDLDPSRTSADVFFDPRVDGDKPEAMPAAGVLTMMATMSSFPRERVRGARALEIFACRDFSPPPPEVHFPDYVNDPATGGPCIACHTLIDPASIHFKRWGFLGYTNEPLLAGISHHGNFADHPSYDDAFKRWGEVFVADTKLTPVSAERVAAFPEARFIDFLPPDQTLLGITSDGTIGPRGFGKIIVESGEFDACMARRLYERFTGEKLVDGQDATRIRALRDTFVAGGRAVRPFVRSVVANPACFAASSVAGCEFNRGL